MTERTLVLVKPDGVQRLLVGRILARYEERGLKLVGLKLMTVEGMTHPFAVVRAAELQRWAASEDYRAILSGQYQRRDEDEPSSSLMDDIRGAAKSYKDSWSTSPDPLMKVFTNVGEAVSGLSEAWTRFWAVSTAKSPRIEPGAASWGRVAPFIARTIEIAFGPSSTAATSGPLVMKSTRPLKKGFSRWTA